VTRWSLDFRYQSATLPTNSRAADGVPLYEPHDGAPFACYPPEADFLVRSRARPADVVTEWSRFHAIRTEHLPSPVTGRWERAEAEQIGRPPGPLPGVPK